MKLIASNIEDGYWFTPVLNFSHFNLGFVSDFEIRISDFFTLNLE